ncbi:MAG: 50S ribosomal protein L23 [Planctomycetota bacterium]|jgi:large subunit ribosomal protein L23
MTRNPHDIVRRPLITEKGTDLQGRHNGYTFMVAPTANKIEIRRAVEALFEVRVVNVRTMTRHGKLKGRGRMKARKPDWKRAIVTLADGQTVEFL